MKRWWVILAAALGACGNAAPPEIPDGPRGHNEGKPFMPASVTTGGMQAAAAAREPMRFVAEAGELVVEARIDGRSRRFTLAPEMVALRLGDVPSLEYPVGFVKLNPLTFSGEDTSQARTIVDAVLRSGGSPIQIFVDVHSVADMKGRLAEAGSVASGAVLGVIQVDDKQTDLTIHTLFERKAADGLAIEIPPFDLSLAKLGLTDALARLAPLIGARRIDDTVKVSGTLSLVQFTGDQLPTFVRTPVTVSRVAEIRERIDAEIPDHEAARMKLIRTGVPEEIANTLQDEAWFEAMRDDVERNRVRPKGR